jgi:hypothetical protein
MVRRRPNSHCSMMNRAAALQRRGRSWTPTEVWRHGRRLWATRTTVAASCPGNVQLPAGADSKVIGAPRIYSSEAALPFLGRGRRHAAAARVESRTAAAECHGRRSTGDARKPPQNPVLRPINRCEGKRLGDPSQYCVSTVRIIKKSATDTGGVMTYWCGVAFGVGAALFFVGLGTIPSDGSALPWLKWGGAVVALAGCVGAYLLRKHAATSAGGLVSPR